MLTESQIKKAKPREKTYQLSVGDGLSLVVEKTGQKYWKLRYVDEVGLRKVKRLGEYPLLNLRSAKIESQKFLEVFQTEIKKNENITFKIVAENS